MKKIVPVIALSGLLLAGCAQVVSMLPEIGSVLASGGGLTTEEIIAGLKEALTVGATNSAALASKTDGFYLNSVIRIPFPQEAIRVKDAVAGAGFSSLVSDFEKSLNRAAEEASKKALPIFKDAILGMTITDARKILQGGENAATLYLQGKTQSALVSEFTPVVKNALQTVDVTRYWTPLLTAYNTLTIGSGQPRVNTNLEQYVTEKALAGLFHLVGQEEKKIREDPAARVTEILKKVFGSG